ncbi:MAG: ComEC/Rec2 family competence protein, partial [Planctomycetota bacterium]|nr:ComEC/Rec2 family competence protein [Planctomycetota bacterium]
MKVPSGPSSGSSSNGPPGYRGSRLTLLALAFALGIALAREMPPEFLWGLIATGWLGLLLAFLSRKRFPKAMMGFILMVMFALGGAWCIVRLSQVSPMDLAAQLDDTNRLVHVKGIALETPRRRDRTSGSMGQFDYRAASMNFPLRVEALVDQQGRDHRIHGSILVRVSETIAPLKPGDRIEAKGFLSAPSRPSNPGEFDYRFLSRAKGLAGTLHVPTRELLVVMPASRQGVGFAYRQWRESLQQRAGGWLLSNLPDDEAGQRDVLLKALLLGQREMGQDELTESFRRLGLAHLMAISGLHLGVLAGFVLLILRLLAIPTRRHGLFIIVIVLVYLFLVEVRMPVMRAGVMTIASSLALVFGRHLKVSGLVALSAILLLAWRPDQLFTPGFQLSFGVVLGIVHFAPTFRRRWFGRPDLLVSSTLQMLGQWAMTALAITATAWMFATPITVYHFGVVSPMAVPMS